MPPKSARRTTAYAAPASPRARPDKPGAQAKAAPPPGRGIGRPGNGGSIGRERLLKTACELLKTVPPCKLTRFMVAKRANVDPSLIRYYFRDRVSLLAAAADRLSAQFLDELTDQQRAAAPTGLARLQARLDLNISTDTAFANYRRLLMDELLVTDTPQARLVTAKISARGAASTTAMIADGVADGTLRDADGTMLFIAIVALSSYAPLARPLYEAATGRKIGQKAIAERYRNFVTSLVSRGLAP